MAKKQPESYIEHSQITVGREDDYEIHIARKPGDEGWEITQDDTVIFLPDDEAMDAMLTAATALTELVKGLR